MATALVAAPPVTRWAWIDKLRVTVIAGVIAFHTATAYVVPVPWYYEERTTSAVVQNAFSVPMLLLAVFGLGPLFLVAGWLSSVSLARRGGQRFVRSRLLRLAVPVLVYVLLIDPVASFLGARGESRRVTLAHFLLDLRGARGLGPMWFVVALLAFSLAYAGWRAVRPARPADAVLGARVLVVLVVVIAAVDFVTWLRWPYLADTPFNLDLQHWPQAAGMFVLGALAGERDWFAQLPGRLVRRCGWLLVAGLAALLALAGYCLSVDKLVAMVGGLHWPTVVFAVLDGAIAVALAVWTVGWFQTRWNAPPGPITATAGRASYAAYVLHPLILIGLSIAARGLPWPPEIKFLIVAAVGILASFAIGHLTVRVPGINRVV
jgi:peptidoglycan/LPS O-acetylase OafA/YrhL